MISLYRSVSFPLLLSLSLLSTSFTSFVSSSLLTPPVSTNAGVVQGYTFGDMDYWRGIPFAAPPTGNNRFRPPQPVEPWSGTKLTLINGQICPQVRLTDYIYLGNEDCLYLDVYAPSNRDSQSPLPVYVWFFGGGYVFGDGYEFGFYDGANLAREANAIIVTVNYRLGSLGLLALDELKAEDPNGIVGNYALLDQVSSLQWVQSNIAAFGGDPNQVTIAGESAGAFSVCWHIASPLSAGLFNSAIMQSGTCNAEQFFLPYSKSQSWSRAFAKSVSCDPDDSANLLSCLRNLSPGALTTPGGTTIAQTGEMVKMPPPADNTTNTPLHLRKLENDVETLKRLLCGDLKDEWQQSILAHRNVDPQVESLFMTSFDRVPLDIDFDESYFPPLWPVMPWSPTVDGVSLPDNPLNVITAGKHNNVPIIMGTNHDEGSIFVPMMILVFKFQVHFPIQAADLPRIISHFFPNATQQQLILQEYPVSDYSSVDSMIASVLRDYFFACSNRRALRAFHPYQPTSTYLYHFDYPGDFVEDPVLGDYHSSELEFTFGNAWPPVIHHFSQNDTEMSADFIGFFGNFIHSHDPNVPTPRSETWPVYVPDTEDDVIMSVPLGEEDELYESKCLFWDQIWEVTKANPDEVAGFPPEVLKAMRKKSVELQRNNRVVMQ